MSLSSSTLIHLTTQKAYLVGILKEGFKVKYCQEDIKTKGGSINGAFPMVSLSDLPLSELDYHLESYGNYGIGLKKEWAKKNGLNPVLYFDGNSTISHNIRKDFEDIYKKVLEGKLENKLFQLVTEIMSYMKNYEGTLKTKKITRENYRFSDEREWRYIPSLDILGSAFPYIVPKNAEEKAKANKKLEHIRLEFTPDDINYIFVQKESEIQEIIDIIRNANATMPYSSVERLMTRILTTEQIMTDI
ncbi:abortive infection system antitoxin AbiGi family protein [Sediminibacterium sp.]|uniref:abortive infection system antitoxin AbiGi family protein n=1 Tax=Sediminibacterium sp. TaxID=1917865 RepID=UPI0025F37625|nr:abortive infection system antitoxin AbiGi family protein [Sediminibacterium sp.]MBW0179395.1 hypothetical protein [Sediminibacterium sp.]